MSFAENARDLPRATRAFCAERIALAHKALLYAFLIFTFIGTQPLVVTTPEERLAGLDLRDLLASLPPEQRLVGLSPEEQLASLSPAAIGCPNSSVSTVAVRRICASGVTKRMHSCTALGISAGSFSRISR